MILISGANGFVGTALCHQLVASGLSVRGSVRWLDQTGALASGVDHVQVGEIGPNTDWAKALDGVTVVIHLAARVHVMRDKAVDRLGAFRAVNLAGTYRLAQAAVASGVRRMVFVSSIKVNGEYTGAGTPFVETDMPAPNEPYGMSKHEAEQMLRRVEKETGLEIVIVRPPLIYGPHVRGNLLRMLKLVGKGIPLPLGSVDNRRSMIYIGNFVAALEACAVHPAAAGKTYLVSDGEDVSSAQLVRSLARLMGNPSRLWSFPPSLLWLAACCFGKSDDLDRLLGSLVVDSSKIRRELGWLPPFTMEQGLVEMVNWYRKSRGRT